MSAKRSVALIRIVQCQTALIEELLKEDYEFVLTARFQSDPLERRDFQYSQMSGSRFLVSTKDVDKFEKILKITALIDEDLDSTPEFKSADGSHDAVKLLHTSVESRVSCVDSLYHITLQVM